MPNTGLGGEEKKRLQAGRTIHAIGLEFGLVPET